MAKIRHGHAYPLHQPLTGKKSPTAQRAPSLRYGKGKEGCMYGYGPLVHDFFLSRNMLVPFCDWILEISFPVSFIFTNE
jgi:hypothetical protein